MPDTTPTPPPYRYIDQDEFCLSARLLPDLNTGAPTGTLSLTIEGSDEPQSAHVPVTDLPQVLAGIARAAGLPAPAAPADRATVLREAATAARIEGQRLAAEMSGDAGYGARAAAKVISCMADEAQPTETYPPAFPWAALMDTEDLVEFLAEIEHAIATPGATPAEALAAAETACSTWRLIAEAQHGHNTASGPAEPEEPQP